MSQSLWPKHSLSITQKIAKKKYKYFHETSKINSCLTIEQNSLHYNNNIVKITCENKYEKMWLWLKLLK